LSRSAVGRVKSPSPVITTKGILKSSSDESFTGLKRRSVAMEVFCWTVERNSSLKHLDVLVPA